MKGNTMKRTCAMVLFLVSSGVSVDLTVAQNIYWIDNNFPDNQLQRSDLNGENIVTIFKEAGLSNFAIDTTSDHIYWGSGGSPNARIMRSNLDGSNPTIVMSIEGTPADIALDLENNKFYWVDVAEGRIQRANLDGTSVELLDMLGAHVTAIALDVEGGKMYYMVTSLDSVRRADLDGQNPEVLITGASSGRAVALDLVARKLYFDDTGVQRSNLDGTDIETIASSGGFGISVVPEDQRVYWTNSVDGTVHRANLDGSNDQIVISGLSNPRRIAVIGAAGVPVPTAGTWSMMAMAILLMTAATLTLRHQTPKHQTLTHQIPTHQPRKAFRHQARSNATP